VKVSEIREHLGLEAVAGAKGLAREVRAGYCGDLLSDVIANAGQGSVWITIQGHQNVVAVAVLKEMAALILANGRQPDEETRTKADEEGIPLLLSPLKSFQLAGRLYELGIGRMEG
jgi:predicted transcriptional regulator